MNKAAVLTYMRSEVNDHYDRTTGEVNATTLAEDACAHFAAWDGDDVPEEFFEAAFVVAVEHSRRQRRMELFAEKPINYQPDGDVIWA